MTRYMIPVRRKIRLSTMTDIKDFNSICTKINGDVDVVIGRHVIDGKSLLGLYSLDFTQELEVVVYADDDEEIGTFLPRIGKWMVEE